METTMPMTMPKVGDKIKIVDAWLAGGKYQNGDVLTVAEIIRNGIAPAEFYHWIGRKEFVILAEAKTQPDTDFVTIDGISTQVREVKRPAKVGEYIKVVNWDDAIHDYTVRGKVSNGQVHKVIDDKFGTADIAISSSRFGSASLLTKEYVVLEQTGIVQVDSVQYLKVTNLFPEAGDLVLVKSNSDGNKAGKHHCGVPSVTKYIEPGYYDNKHVKVEHEWGWQTVLKSDIDFVVKADSPTVKSAPTPIVDSAPMPDTSDAKRTDLQSQIDKLTAEIRKLPSTSAAERQAKREAAIAFAKQYVADIQAMGGKYNGERKNLSLLNGSIYYDYYYRISFETSGRTVKATVQACTFGGMPLTSIRPNVGTCVFSDNVAFNEHIAKAKALAAALGVKMPSELANIPEPTVAKVGNVVKGTLYGQTRKLVSRSPEYDSSIHGTAFRTEIGTWFGVNQFDIVDDTNP